ncbi:MAG: AAA family ATPase, partial [Bacteroidales bacterium]|nr:AAA family ATPase [Bacteroidales bacterium]
MESLLEKSASKINSVQMNFIRGLADKIDWRPRLLGIKGSRGVGKTTLLLQYLKKNFEGDDSVAYISLDNLWFSRNRLEDFIDWFVKRGGKHLFIDEVHKYPQWSQILKNSYDDYPELQIVFTGSSMLEILNSRADLSRRAVVYNMQGLSFREYLNITCNLNIPVYTLDDIMVNHKQISKDVLDVVKPLKYFSTYLKSGYFPFYNELPDHYFYKIEEVINMVLEVELPLMRNLEISYVTKIKQILQIIAESVPFIPNVSKLSERVGINRNTLLSYLFYLAEANMTLNVYKDVAGITKLQKPDKIYLENTNMIYALCPQQANVGNLRETFFVNQLNYANKVEYVNHGDFKINGIYTFEVGGKS